MKHAKDVLFFQNNALSDDDSKTKSTVKAPTKKPPVKPINGIGSPAKNKIAGGKVLRNKTRSSAQEDVLLTTHARIAEHQRELHATKQREGLAKYSEEGEGTGNKEGKGWKRFQSYKGEAGLPKEVDSMRVRRCSDVCWESILSLTFHLEDLCGSQSADYYFTSSWISCSLPYQHDKERK